MPDPTGPGDGRAQQETDMTDVDPAALEAVIELPDDRRLNAARNK